MPCRDLDLNDNKKSGPKDLLSGGVSMLSGWVGGGRSGSEEDSFSKSQVYMDSTMGGWKASLVCQI